MADVTDRASELEERHREEALAAQRAEAERRRRIEESMRPAPPIDEPQDCVECGEPIPVERLRLYPRTRRCTACASEIERTYGG